MIISTVAEKTFDKSQNQFMIKSVNKLGKEGNFLNFMKGIYKNTAKKLQI